MNYIIREIQEKDYLKVAILYKELRKVSEKHMFEGYVKLRKEAGMKSDEQVIIDVIQPKKINENSKFLEDFYKIKNFENFYFL